MKLSALKNLFSSFLSDRHFRRHFKRLLAWDSIRKQTSRTLQSQTGTYLYEYSSIEEQRILDRLNTTTEGLSNQEAENRIAQYGLNAVDTEQALLWWQHLWHCYKNPFNLLLSVLAIVSLISGDAEGAVVISFMVVVSVILRFVQERRSDKAADALKAMVSRYVRVLRHDQDEDGVQSKSLPISIAFDQLVPGDVIALAAGDLIPADCRLLSAKDLFISQTAMTGESLPVEKSVKLNQEQANENPILLSNLLFMGTTVVSGTANAVVLRTGEQTYFGLLAKKVVQKDSAPSAFQKGVNQISWLLIRFSLIMSPIVLLINGFGKGDWSEALLFALSVAVGLTPEMLPMIVTSALAKGAVTLSRKKVIVKSLESIQAFGAMTVLCTDKTGTLTCDEVALEFAIDVKGEKSDAVLESGALNSHFQTGLRNLLDRAVLKAAELRFDDQFAMFEDWNKIDELPFDFNRRRMSVVLQNKESMQKIMITKGACQEILSICLKSNHDGQITDLNDTERKNIERLIDDLNHQGLRVIAVATREFPESFVDGKLDDESAMTLVGFLAFLDPPKESAVQAIEALGQHGVRLKVLTGDNLAVTTNICKQVGISVDEVCSGNDLMNLNEQAFAKKVMSCSVFAQLTPDHKERIVLALKEQGEVVGFLGDGINDAPALRTADVGISVDTATDIAKESADIILLEKSLMVLEQGVLEGRRTFVNMMKYIRMASSSNFGNVFSVLVASLLLPFLPMMPVQLLVQNLLYDISQIVIPFDGVDEKQIAEPVQWDAKGIGRFMIFFGPLSSIFDILTFLLMWFIFKANTSEHQALFQSGWFVEGLITQTLVVHAIRSEKIPFIQSRAAASVTIMSLLIAAIGIYLPMGPLASYFGLVALPGVYFAYLSLFVILYFVSAQLLKGYYIKRYGWRN